MNYRLDIYQKITITITIFGMLLIFMGFIISPPINSYGQKSTIIAPDTVHKIDEHTQEYMFDFNSAIKFSCLYFITDLSQVYVYQDENLIYSIEEGTTPIGKTPGKIFHFVEIPSKTSTLTVVSRSKYINESPLTFMVGDRQSMITDTLLHAFPSLIVYLMIFFGGILLFLYWAIVRKELIDNKVGLYLSLLLIVSGLWFIRGSDFINILFRDHIAIYFMGYILFLQFPYLLFAFMVYYWKAPCKLWFKNTYCIISYFTMLICTLLHVLGVKEFKETAFITHILLIAAIIYAFYGMYNYWKIYRFNYKIIFTGLPLFFVLLSTFIDYWDFYKAPMESYERGGIVILFFWLCISAVTFYELSLQLREGRKNAIYKRLATTDLLTGLKNRNAYETWENEHKQNFDDVSLILCDLNNLKYYNDNYGHAIGDKYIIAASEILSKAVEQKGICYRIGGDEFIIILQNTTYEVIKGIFEDFESMQQEFNKNSNPFIMGLSYGYATREKNDKFVTDMIKRADAAMYAHKKKSKIVQQQKDNK